MPSEFGLDPARMGHALEPGRVTFDDKMAIRKAIEESNIPFTYISANLFAGYFAGSLSQMGSFVPPRDKVHLFGDGKLKGILPLTLISSIYKIDFHLNYFIPIKWYI